MSAFVRRTCGMSDNKMGFRRKVERPNGIELFIDGTHKKVIKTF